MINALLKGHSIIIFPESAWNLSPNKLHLPMNYGFIDVAKKAQVPIVPMVIEYTYDANSEKEKIVKIQIKYGKTINVTEADNLLEKLQEYNEAVATMRYELIESKGITSRKNVSNWEYINFLKGNYKNLKLGKIDISMERNGIQGASDEFYKFYYINDHRFDDNGNILETEEVRRMKNIIFKK